MACQEGAPCINDILPRELLVRIASLLDEGVYETSSNHFSQVCKEWRLIGRQGVRSLLIRCPSLGKNPDDQVMSCLTLFPCLDNLHLVLADDFKQQSIEAHEKVLEILYKSSVRITHLEFSFDTDSPSPKSRAVSLPKTIFEWEWLESFALCDELVLGDLPQSEAAKWTHLKNLTLERCNDLHLASKWTSLQTLQINKLELKNLPVGIGNWKKLKVLVLGSYSRHRHVCSRFQQFPPSVVSWSQLEVLRLHAASELESLPPEVSAWSSLRELSLSSCSSLTELPSQVASWRSLHKLELTSCFLLHGLPVEVNSWKGLRILIISCCSNFQNLSEGVQGWTDFQELDLDRCAALETLPLRA